MNWMLALAASLLLATRANCQAELVTQTEDRTTRENRRIPRSLPELPQHVLPELTQHVLLDMVGVGREEVNSVLKVLGSMFNFVDIYGRPRYPVMDSYYSWFKWVDRNLPLVMGTYMAPYDLDPHDEYAYYDEEEFDYNLFSPFDLKMTSTHNVLWSDFYKTIYSDMISQNAKTSKSDGNRRQGFSCLNSMYPGYSTIQVDAMGKMFKMFADNTLTPAYEFIMGKDPQRASMMQVDPLRALSENLAYFVGLSDGEDSYSSYESRIDAEDRSVRCLDSTARVMNEVMPYGPFLTFSNVIAVGVWLSAFLAPFL
ncbi:unnamed protein product [Meganyctiphanes norvegica]|uniref:Uncharacterized protein n=1 Tax=Meganyctiphanes norvegica TaxID=48144 RepID=A0AAV2QZ98_MEGNR